MCTAIAYVRFTPESGHVRCTSSCLLWAKSGLMHCSNYPINSSARASSVGGIARPSSLAVFRLMTVSYFGRRLHRQVGRLLALEDAIDVACRTAVLISCVRPIGDQTAGNDEETFPVDRRQLAPSRKRDDQIAVTYRHATPRNDKTATWRACESLDRPLGLARVTHVNRNHLN